MADIMVSGNIQNVTIINGWMGYGSRRNKGWQSTQLGVACIVCSAGTYSNISNLDMCICCDVNSYTDIIGALSCTLCPANSGAYSANINSTTCLTCGVGKFLPNASSMACKLCPANSNSGHADAARTTCVCNPGWTLAHTETTECVECPTGKFKNVSGHGPCSECPAGAGHILQISTAPRV